MERGDEERMEAMAKLNEIREEGIFTRGQTYEEFLKGLCDRYARLYGEILPSGDPVYIIQKLEEKGLL
jgi:hypothetical protein